MEESDRFLFNFLNSQEVSSYFEIFGISNLSDINRHCHTISFMIMPRFIY